MLTLLTQLRRIYIYTHTHHIQIRDTDIFLVVSSEQSSHIIIYKKKNRKKKKRTKSNVQNVETFAYFRSED